MTNLELERVHSSPNMLEQLIDRIWIADAEAIERVLVRFESSPLLELPKNMNKIQTNKCSYEL
jgi:hypothetical protein